MHLSDRDIRKALETGRLVARPLAENAIQPASIDVRLSDKWLRERGTELEGTRIIDGRWVPCVGNTLWLSSGAFVLASTMEYIEVADDLVVEISGKSSLGRNGVLVHATAGWVDPGFRGTLTLELYNLSNRVIPLRVGDFIAQLKVIQLSSPAEHPYSGRYLGQDGPTAPR